MATTVTGSYVPKLLGCYEAELHPAVERIVGTGYRQVIDVGCGEGYYLVGLATRMSGTAFIGFDLDPTAREACNAQAALNGVAGAVQVRESCDPETLAGLDLSNTLLISDCEGYEMDLLRPDAARGLAACDLLVELHEGLRPGVTRAITDRFTATHDISLVDCVTRDPSRFPELEGFTEAEKAMVLNESRYGPMQFMIAWAKKTCNG